MKDKIKIKPTAIADEFDLRNGGIKAHFKLIKSHTQSGRRAYLRTEHVSGKTSFEVIQPIKHVIDGEIIFTYPGNERFGSAGVYIDGDDIFRDEKINYYLENGFTVSYREYLKSHKS